MPFTINQPKQNTSRNICCILPKTDSTPDGAGDIRKQQNIPQTIVLGRSHSWLPSSRYRWEAKCLYLFKYNKNNNNLSERKRSQSPDPLRRTIIPVLLHTIRTMLWNVFYHPESLSGTGMKKKRMEQNIWEKVCDIHTYLENFLYCSENEHPFHCIERRKEKSQLTYQHLYANKLCARNILLLLPSANLLLVRGKHSETPTNLVELKPSLTAYHKPSAGCYHLGWLQTNSFDPGPTAASLLF